MPNMTIEEQLAILQKHISTRSAFHRKVNKAIVNLVKSGHATVLPNGSIKLTHEGILRAKSVAGNA